MRILLVEDDELLREATSIGLRLQLQDIEVLLAEDGRRGLARAEQDAPDLVLLDVNLPGLNGFEVLRHLRQHSDVPVILLTARDEEIDKVRGLELGADDYVVKPFHHRELIARIRAVMRRADLTPPVGTAPSVTSGEVAIHFENRLVTKSGEPVSLTPTEFRLVAELAAGANRVQTYQSLTTRVWGDDRAGESDYLKVYINRLRRKLEADPAHPKIILNERGLGYRFVRTG